MSYLMDYGPDWPPAPEPAPADGKPLTLGEKCLIAVIAYALIWAASALLILVLNRAG